MVTPYQPTAFATPVVSPSVIGYSAQVPYISASQYIFAPTAMDTSTLVENGSAQDQTRALNDTILRASRWIDNYCLGATASTEGASLRATQATETAYVKPLQGFYNLVCDQKPVLQAVGVAFGFDPSSLQNLDASVANQIQIGRKVIKVPAYALPILTTNGGTITSTGGGWATGAYGNQVYVVWSYISGYPHMALASSITAAATSCTVTANGPSSSVLGVYIGSRLTVPDGVNTETVTVTGVTGTTISTTAFAYAHTVPTTPDFLPVTGIPDDVQLAAIFYTTALIKSRGDNALVLDELVEPTHVKLAMSDVAEDVANAMELLDAYKITNKFKR